MKDKIQKLRRKEQLIREKIRLTGQKIHLRNTRRQLHKLQVQGLNLDHQSVSGFIQRGNKITSSLFGLKKKK